jgi:transcriptional regulator with XRE-family HTH domain
MESIHPLREYRQAQEPPMSMAKLAQKLGVGRPTLFRWESGARKIDAARLPEISEKTGIPAKRLRPDLYEKFGEVVGG